jgi:hypothetical protein
MAISHRGKRTMSISILRISRPRGDAHLICRFVHQLTILSGVSVSARQSTTGLGRWQIVWSDGPTVIAMRRLAAELGQAVAGVDLDQLTWQRTSRAGHWDLQGVRKDELANPPRSPAA